MTTISQKLDDAISEANDGLPDWLALRAKWSDFIIKKRGAKGDIKGKVGAMPIKQKVIEIVNNNIVVTNELMVSRAPYPILVHVKGVGYLESRAGKETIDEFLEHVPAKLLEDVKKTFKEYLDNYK